MAVKTELGAQALAACREAVDVLTAWLDEGERLLAEGTPMHELSTIGESTRGEWNKVCFSRGGFVLLGVRRDAADQLLDWLETQGFAEPQVDPKTKETP